MSDDPVRADVAAASLLPICQCNIGSDGRNTMPPLAVAGFSMVVDFGGSRMPNRIVDVPSRDAPTLPLGVRLMSYAHTQLEQAQAELGREGEDRHEGIHRARKCIRRTRAALALGAGALGQKAEVLDDELRRLCRGLSYLRDSQALVEVLNRLDARQSQDADRTLLSAAELRARQRRDEILERSLVRDPAFMARRIRLKDVRQRLNFPDGRSLGEDDVRREIEHSRRRVDKAAKQIKKHPDDDDAWHVYRRRLRRLHQQDTLLNDMIPTWRLSKKRHCELAGVLGESQDDVLLLRCCGRGSPFTADQRKFLRAIAQERLRRTRSDEYAHDWSR